MNPALSLLGCAFGLILAAGPAVGAATPPPFAPAPAKEAPPPPAVRVYKAEAPTIDGNLGDPCWSQAIWMHPFTTWPEEVPAAHQSFVVTAWDEANFYVALRCLAPDPQLLRIADGNPRLNDRVDLVLHWDESDEQRVLVDAAGRLRISQGLQGTRAAAQRGSAAYTVEIAVPRPAKAHTCHFYVRRANEVLGEVSGWGTAERPVEATLTSRPGPLVHVRDVPRYPAEGTPVKLNVTNPTDGYLTVRCRVTRAEYAVSMPHLVRLKAQQGATVNLAYNPKDVAKVGLHLVVDEPSGRVVYLRAPVLRPPLGKKPRPPAIDVFPHPRSVKLPDVDSPEEMPNPFFVSSDAHIRIGSRSNETEVKAAERVRDLVQRRCGVELDIHAAGLFTSFDKAISIISEDTDKTAFKRLGKQLGLAVPTTRKYLSYAIGITSDKVGLLAVEDLGIRHGIETLIQLLETAERHSDVLFLPWMRIRDYPTYDLRGCIWRGPRFDHPAIYPALRRLRLNLLTTTPGADAELARANGIHLASLPQPGQGSNAGDLVVRVTPSETMPSDLRRSLHLPISLVGTGARPASEPFFNTPAPPEEQPVEEYRGPMVKVETVPVSFAWTNAEPWPILHASRWGKGRPNVVGICGELRGDGLLTPSWARVALAAEYGWSTRLPEPEDYNRRFYRFFYGTTEVRKGRRLPERAAAALPRRTSLAELLDPDYPDPRQPRADLAELVRAGRAKIAQATRNKPLADLLAASGGRVLAAAANVSTALRLRRLYAKGADRHAQGQRHQAAQQLQAIADTLTKARQAYIAALDSEVEAADDAKLYAAAAAAAQRIAKTYANNGQWPEAARFWAALRGE